MLRHLGKGLALCVGIAALAGSPAQAATAEYGFDFASAYVWRGLTVVDGAVWQPSFTLAHDSGFSFNTWGNLDLDSVNGNEGEFTEVDLTAAYAFPTEGTTGIEVGIIEYLFPNTGGTNNATTELYVGLSWDVITAPFITLYYDIDEIEDYYVDFGLGFGGDFTDSASWELGVSAAWAGEDFARLYAGGVDSGFFNGNITFSVGTEINEYWGIGAFVAFTDNLDSNVLPDQKVDFYGGISISAAF